VATDLNEALVQDNSSNSTPLSTIEESPVGVSIVGYGAIGRAVADRLLAGSVPGFGLVGVVDRKPLVSAPAGLQRLDFTEALGASQIMIECAGAEFVRHSARAIVENGVDLVLCSIGAYADPELRAELNAAGPGRIIRPTGAIGALDFLEAAARFDRFDRVTLTTTKPPRALVRDWMSDDAQKELVASTAPREVFRGSVRKACELYPSSINVAAAIAMAINDFDAVEVVIRSDPGASCNRHTIDADATFGQYQFNFENRPSPENPRTSGIVAASVLHALEQLAPRQRARR
jgi:aspartate dehydrogenase